MHKICFYVPIDFVESVKTALFDAGAGKIGVYSNCCWQTLGEGQFMPENGSNPFIGDKNRVEKVPEYKVEMVCSDDNLEAAIDALMRTHPYETPAYQIIRCVNYGHHPLQTQ